MVLSRPLVHTRGWEVWAARHHGRVWLKAGAGAGWGCLEVRGAVAVWPPAWGKSVRYSLVLICAPDVRCSASSASRCCGGYSIKAGLPVARCARAQCGHVADSALWSWEWRLLCTFLVGAEWVARVGVFRASTSAGTALPLHSPAQELAQLQPLALQRSEWRFWGCLWWCRGVSRALGWDALLLPLLCSFTVWPPRPRQVPPA